MDMIAIKGITKDRIRIFLLDLLGSVSFLAIGAVPLEGIII